MPQPDEIVRIRRTNVPLWLAVVCFAYYYKAIFCGLLGHQLGLRFLCFTWVHGISTNHWFEIIVYCPLLWLALHQINTDVFGILPGDPARRRRTFRHQLVGEFAIALVIYGTGIHIANVIEIFARERAGVTDGSVYRLVYYLDEGVSHYVQFVPLFFVLGWFVIHDLPGRIGHPRLALFFGVGHGVERAIGIIEGGKWFLSIPASLWLLVAWRIRLRRHDDRWDLARRDFLFRYAVALSLALPLAVGLYYASFGTFAQPSSREPWQLSVLGAAALAVTLGGSVLAAAVERRRRRGVLIEP
jgi:hypothetical protein